jgi:photosystem II stability/assembly factor-like uncharacterized protein
MMFGTTDGGETWEPQTTGGMYGLQAADFVDASHGWTVGSSGIVLGTTDGGG